MHHANDNEPRTPAQHRAAVAQQTTTGERAYQGGSWPQGKRLHKAGNVRLLTGLAAWQQFNAMPRLSAANDNEAVSFENAETSVRDAVSADEIVAAVEKEKEEPGKHYREDSQEVFVRGEWRTIASTTGSDRRHSAAAPAWMVDDTSEEDKAAGLIDLQRVRQKLGSAVCILLDMAAGDSTTGEIADAIGVSRAKAEKYVDAVIEKYLQVAG
ncbi:hypothetical protein [Bradyrhizobium sp. JR3.5]